MPKPNAKRGKGHVLPKKKPKQNNKAFHVTRKEELLKKTWKKTSDKRQSRTPDEQSTAWSAYGDLKGRLNSTSFRPTFTVIKPKRYKRFSNK